MDCCTKTSFCSKSYGVLLQNKVLAQGAASGQLLVLAQATLLSPTAEHYSSLSDRIRDWRWSPVMALQLALAKVDEDGAMERGPVHGASPPRHKQRTGEDDEEEVKSIDNIVDQTRFLKRELRTIIEETAADQEKRFEKRFSKLEQKLQIMAKGADGAIQEVQRQIDADKVEAKKWQEEMVQKLVCVESKIVGSIPARVTPTPVMKQGGREKTDEDMEKKTRTVTFGQFPLDTKADEIKNFIDNILESVKGDLQETYAFGKTRAERGAARFTTKTAMWAYMTKNKGKHQHLFKGAKGEAKIYCNVDDNGGVGGGGGKVRAVRKVIRTLIETNGGNGELVKQSIETNNRGVVRFKDERVAECIEEVGGDGHMKLLGAMVQHECHFKALMDNRKSE